MKPILGCILGLAIVAGPLAAATQPLPRPVRLEEIGPCVWANLDPQTQTQLVGAFDAGADQYVRATASLQQKLGASLSSCWTLSPEDQAAAAYIAGIGVLQEVLARLILRDESVGRAQLDASITQAPQALKDQLAQAARALYLGQPAAPPALTTIFQTMGLSTDPAYLQSPRGRRVTAYVIQTFQVKAAAADPAAIGRRRTVDLAGMGSCVWDQLNEQERAPVIAAVESGGAQAFSAAESTIGRRTFALALECTPSIVADQSTAAKVMSISLRQQATAVLLERNLLLSRQRLNEALNTAPPALITSLRQAGEALARQQPPTAAASLDPLFEALGQPVTPEFKASKPAQWIATYGLYAFTIRALAAQFGASAAPQAAPAPAPARP